MNNFVFIDIFVVFRLFTMMCWTTTHSAILEVTSSSLTSGTHKYFIVLSRPRFKPDFRSVGLQIKDQNKNIGFIYYLKF